MIGGGRLGNQIFQYAFIKKIEPLKTTILGANLENLKELFEIEDNLILIPDNKIIKYIIWKFGRGFLRILGKIRLFDYYEQEYKNTHLDKYIHKKGLISSIKIINFGYYQSEMFFRKDIKNKLIIKRKYLNEAMKIIKPFKIRDLVFVHIRRGDYVELGGNLPKEYYKKSIEYFKNKLNDPFFIFLSDDIEWVKKEFNFLKDISYFSENNLYIDFTLMTLCEYGIMSNSTFSYWGGYLMKNRKEVLFPKYWLGYKEKRYSPIGIKPTWAKEVEID
jgi:hypothetical protein